MNSINPSDVRRTVTVSYSRGSVICAGLDRTTTILTPISECLKWDERTGEWRARGMDYRGIVEGLRSGGYTYKDLARAYERLPLKLAEPISPRSHQAAALKSWKDAGATGVIQLPTGAGKTILAVMAIADMCRPTLVIVPTIDLVLQWQVVLQRYVAGATIGALGGGQKEIAAITVSTYDSALIFMEQLGNKFGLLIVDECHHLPSPQYQAIAMGVIAPFRMGLSATVERSDGKEELIYELLGPLVYEGRIDELQSSVLAPYDVVSIQVALTDEERSQYAAARDIYLSFVKRHKVNFSSPAGWSEFLWKAAKFPGGREALKAHRQQKRLAQAASAKIELVWKILKDNQDERIIVFTDDNALAYQIGREYLLPVLTHQTKLSERTRILDGFRTGVINVLVTSRVLNEGVDVPEASVGVVVSGTGNVREHVQRLGRILRHRPGKRAKLYELISHATSEINVHSRRRQHHAYQRTSALPRA